MDVSELVAGRELDALVAEKVMGWIKLKTPLEHSSLTYWVNINGEIGEAVSKWEPSTDISAAWQVVEKMIAEGKEINIHRFDGKWRCIFDPKNLVYGALLPYGDADTAPLAICKASLKAIGALNETL